ncbi:hypothetical protein VTN02DRAFT_6440 [Thermoascus thermophilus]
MVAAALGRDARLSSRFAVENALPCSYSCFSASLGSRSVSLTTVRPVDDPVDLGACSLEMSQAVRPPRSWLSWATMAMDPISVRRVWPSRASTARAACFCALWENRTDEKQTERDAGSVWNYARKDRIKVHLPLEL